MCKTDCVGCVVNYLTGRYRMKSAVILSVGVLALCYVGLANAATEANWARNGEADVKEYNVYACQPSGCVATKNAAMKITPAIPQTAAGVRPKWALPVGMEGSVGVTAVDTAGNESGLSVPVPFDTKAPAIPSDVQTQ